MAGEDFTEKKVVKNLTEVGRSGTFITSNTIQNDYLDELNGQSGQEIFNKMLLSDSQIRKLVHSIANPIRSANWDVEPASDEQKDIDAAALIKQIIFNDLPEGFVAKLDEILTFPWHGHAIFEVVHKNRVDENFGPYTGLANIAFRDQRTIDKWIFSKEGILEKIHQLQSGDVEVNVDILAENLMIFYNEKKGNDSGYAFCRMLYGNYRRKLLYKQLQAIGIERSALPVPTLKFPPQVDPESTEYADALEQLAAFTQGEQAFFALPDGYDLLLNAAGSFDPAKVQAAIKAENEEISGSLVGMWLEMGIGGNSAVGSSTGISADFFKDGIEYLATKITDKFNLELIPNLVALNFPEGLEVMPRLSHSGIADEAGKELMEVVTGYTKAQIITPDESLEDFIRKQHNLPKKMEGDILDNRELQKDNDVPTDDDDTDAPPAPDTPKADEISLSENGKAKTPRALIKNQSVRVADDISKAINFAGAKYTNDVMARYKQLSKSRKQNATSKTKIGGISILRKDLKRSFIETVNLSIDQAKLEIPSKKNVELSSKENDLTRITEKYGDMSDIKLTEFSKMPTHIQLLISKQADLISKDTTDDLKSKLDFTFSSIETKSSDENVIRQALEDETESFAASNQVKIKGTNVVALMVNEGRDTFFFDSDVIDEIHSFTFVNIAPKSSICRELAGTTFNTNDAESLRYSPPLHHNCKSYLRANLKVSKGLNKLEVSTLSPSAAAKKSITL